jgi:TRAP-type C4-dicarboxylate transport system permease large subunit
MIPDFLKDNTTIVKNHTLKTHIFCILLRIIIGLLVISNNIPKKILQILCIFIIITFTYKFFKLTHIWKVYLRTVLSYSIVLFLISKYDNTYNSVAGSIIIVDSLMGLQSRHIFEQIGYVLTKSKIVN